MFDVGFAHDGGIPPTPPQIGGGPPNPPNLPKTEEIFDFKFSFSLVWIIVLLFLPFNNWTKILASEVSAYHPICLGCYIIYVGTTIWGGNPPNPPKCVRCGLRPRWGDTPHTPPKLGEDPQIVWLFRTLYYIPLSLVSFYTNLMKYIKSLDKHWESVGRYGVKTSWWVIHNFANHIHQLNLMK